MTTEAIAFSRHIQKQEARYKTYTKLNFLRRFRYSIEHSDWDEEILAQEEWIDKMCIGVIIDTSLFNTPLLLMLFLK